MLHIMLEKLKIKLQGEGLFAAEHKRAIPPYCKRICVLTSKTGAVIKDIIRTVRNKNKLINIDVVDVRVQGDTAAADIVKALLAVDNLSYDCLILARGGGSFEDLMPFNDEKLARAIYNVTTPIISAVGHETDYSIADFVADARAATPTAAAELVAYDVELVKANLAETIMRIGKKVTDKQRYYTERATSAINAMSDKALRLVDRGDKKLIAITNKMSEKLSRLLAAKENACSNILTALESNNPVKLLKSGYFKVTSMGNVINSVNNIKIGDDITVTGVDGRLDCTVNAVKPLVNKEEINL
ncbi:MAG: exodeoxyribonuclease VII large subunit [Clostridia bacterium]|nr:exodeoxyribonuclease VII large subunit [Clostridia bacterium]